MQLRESIEKIILEHFDDKIKDLIFDNTHIFGDKYRSYHGRIKNGLIVRFFLNEFLKYYDESKLKKNR